jgi:hypothetical protein
LKTFSGRKPSQHPDEIGAFIDLMRSNGVRRYLEIGSRHGDTFHQVMTSLRSPIFGLALDLPGGLWGIKSSQRALELSVADLRSRGIQCAAMFADSQSAETAELVRLHAPFDAILIDGDHTLSGVSRDFELYGGMAPLIAFHDIVGAGQAEKVSNQEVEVPILWGRLKLEYEHVEFIGEGSKMGIGALCK